MVSIRCFVSRSASTARFSTENYLWWGVRVYPWSSSGGSWAPCRGGRCLVETVRPDQKFSMVSLQNQDKVRHLIYVPPQAWQRSVLQLTTECYNFPPFASHWRTKAALMPSLRYTASMTILKLGYPYIYMYREPIIQLQSLRTIWFVYNITWDVPLL